MKKINIAVLLLLLVFQTVLSPISVFASEVDQNNGAHETLGTTEAKSSEEPSVVENGPEANESAGVNDGAVGEEKSVDLPEQSGEPNAPTEKPSTPTEESKTVGENSNSTKSEPIKEDSNSTKLAPTEENGNSAKPVPTEEGVSPEPTEPNIPVVDKARELSHAGLLDSAEIKKTDLSYGEQTGILVKFSEKSDVKLKTGDTLTMTLPSELRGFNSTIELEDYGSCNVTGGQVVCTFNDKVETRENIRGYFEFTIQATNVEYGKSKTINTDFGTDLSKQAVTITHPSGGSSPGVFFYKAGDIQPDKSDEVRWFLNFNLKRESLESDIVLHDQSQGGQKIQRDSFYISTNGNLGDRYFTPAEFESNGYGHVHFEDDNSFEVVIKQEHASSTSFTVSYKTTITAEGVNEKYLKNAYDLTYTVNGQEPVSEKNMVEVKNVFSNGWAEGDLPDKGTLRILKHIEGNKEQVIPGVQFKVFSKEGQQIGDQYTTNDKGIVEVPNLKAGDYYIKEVSAPKYVTFDENEEFPFTIEAGATKGVEVAIGNSLKKFSIEGTKTWENDSEQDRPSDIKVDLLKDDEVIATKTVTAENGWKYNFGNLDQYTAGGKEIKYAVKEQPVEGYESKVEGYDIVNTKIPKGSIVLTKINADTKEKLEGVEFALIDDQGKVIKEKLVTNKNGQIKVDNLSPGKYAFVETKALYGKTEFTIEHDKEDVQVTVENSYNKTTVVLTKHSKNEQGPVLPGAEFKLVNQKGEVIVLKLVTDKDGQIKVDNLSPGKYAFVETKAPKGYQLDAKPIEFEVSLVDKESVIQLKAFNQVEPSEKPTTPEKPVEPSEKPTTPEKPVGPSEKPTTPEKPVGPIEKPVTPEKPVEPSEKPVVPSEKPIEPIEKTYDPKYEGNVVEEPKPEQPVEQNGTKDSEDTGNVEDQKIPEKQEEQLVKPIEKTYDLKNAGNVVEKQINKDVQNVKADKEKQQTSNERLPQTGESNTTLYQVIGLVLVALAGLLLRRRKEI